MKLDKAIRLQEKWNAKHATSRCTHTQLFDHLTLENGQVTTSCVCLVCGELYIGPAGVVPHQQDDEKKLAV